MVRGGTTASQVFSFAGQCAREGHAFYRAVAKHLSDPDVKALFLELASDELEHVREIERMAEHPEEHLAGDEGSLVAQYIQSLVDAAVGRPASEAGRMTRTTGGLVEAVDLGMRAEERAVALYTRARDEARTGATAEVFRRLVEMEKRHLMLLAELRRRLTTEPPEEG
jgi:rubrerythrin